MAKLMELKPKNEMTKEEIKALKDLEVENSKMGSSMSYRNLEVKKAEEQADKLQKEIIKNRELRKAKK